MADNIDALYEQAKKKGVLHQSMTPERFRQEVSTDTGLKSFYDYAGTHGMKLRPYNDFVQKVRGVAEQQTAPAAQSVATPTNPSVRENPAPTNEAEYQQNLQKQAEADAAAGGGRMSDEDARMLQLRMQTANNARKIGKMVDETSQPISQEQKTPVDRASATLRQQLAPDVKKTAMANHMLDETGKDIQQLRQKNYNDWMAQAEGMTPTQKAYMARSYADNPYVGAARRILFGAEARMNDARRQDGVSLRNIGTGLAEFAGSTGRHFLTKLESMASFGMSDLADAKLQRDVLRKLNDNNAFDNPDAVLSGEEKALYDAMVTNIAVEIARQNDTSRWAKSGQITADMIPFVEDIMLGNALFKGFGNAGREAITKAVEKTVKNKLLKWTATNVGDVALSAAESAATAAILPKTYGNMLGNSAELDMNTAGTDGTRMTFGGIQENGMGKAFATAYRDQFKELFTETGGNFKLIGRALVDNPYSQRIMKSSLGNVLQRFGKGTENTIGGRLANEVAYNGVLGEWLEELEGAIYDGDLKNFFTADTQLPMLLSFAVPAALTSSLNEAQRGYWDAKYKHAGRVLDGMLAASDVTDEEKARIMTSLYNSNMEDLSSTISDIVKEIYPEQYQAIMEGHAEKASEANRLTNALREYVSAGMVMTTLYPSLDEEQKAEAERVAVEEQARVDALMTQARAEAEEGVKPYTHQDGNIYPVQLIGKENDPSAFGNILFGTITIGERTGAGGEIFNGPTNNDIVTVRMEDGSVEQVPASDLRMAGEVASAEDVIRSQVERTMMADMLSRRFPIGSTVYLPMAEPDANGNMQSSKVLNITNDGVEIEVEDQNGQPNTTVIPLEIAAENFSPENIGAEPDIVEFTHEDGTALQASANDDGTFTVNMGGEDITITEEQLTALGYHRDIPAAEAAQEQQAGEQTEEQAQEQAPQYPVDEEGNPDWRQMDVQQSAQTVMDLLGNRGSATAYVDDQIKEAEKAQKLAMKQQSHNLNIAQRQAEEQQIRQIQDATAKSVQYWQNVKLRLAQIKTAEEQAAEQEQQRKMMEAREQRSQTAVGTGDGSMASRYNAAQKIDGYSGTTTLADGRELKGHYVLVSADALTPSHNPLNNFAKMEGYPVSESGESINDRDYTNDKEEQQKVIAIAQNYNGNALKNMPVVSDEGMVYNGNGRTMAGMLAAQNNTDADYTSSLLANAQQYGFTEEQIQSIPHARVAFQLDERLPYNTSSLAVFNEQETQTQSNTGKAAGYARKLTPQAISEVLAAVDGYPTIDAFYNDNKAPFDLINRLIEAGVLAQREKAEMVDGDKLSATGRERLGNILLGTVFDNDTIRLMGGDAALKATIIRALPQILENKGLKEFSLESDIKDAITLLHEVRKSKMPFDSFVRQTVMSEDGQVHTAAENYSPFQLLLAEEMSNGGVESFRNVLATYNSGAKAAMGDQLDIFGNVTGIGELQQLVLQRYGKETNQGADAGSQAGPAAQSTQSGDAEVGLLGTVYNQFVGKFKEAVEFLKQKKAGFAKDVLTHPQVDGGIGLYWGNQKAGLEKILAKHPDVLNNLQEILNETTIKTQSDNRIVLESPTHKVIISKMLGDKKTDNWVLSAYEKNDAAASSSDIETASSDLGNGTAAPQSTVSEHKGSEKNPNMQISEEENEKKVQNLTTFGEKYGYSEEVYKKAVELNEQHKSELESLASIEDDNEFEVASNEFEEKLPVGFATIFKDGEVVIVPYEPVVYRPYTLNLTNRAWKVGDSMNVYAVGRYPALIVTKAMDGKVVEAIDIEDGRVVVKDGRILVDNEIMDQEQHPERIQRKHVTGDDGNVREALSVSDEYLREITEQKKLEAARQEVDTNPTDAQKEAGNYKKGHVNLFGFDITLENPKGSTRSGKDADGKAWSITMQNDYGYIRGTESVDGDHIDIYLGDNTASEKVFVMDAINQKTGVFDEHKVLLGFDSADAALDAYLANYEKGWKAGTLTEVSLDEFRKWIESSHRKTKPFAEYKNVKTEGAQGAPATTSEGTANDERSLSEGRAKVERESSGSQDIGVEDRKYMDAEEELIGIIGQEAYDKMEDQFKKDYVTKRTADQKKRADEILSKGEGKFEMGDGVYDWNYFGYSLYKNPVTGKLHLDIMEKFDGKNRWNPYNTISAEGLTIADAKKRIYDVIEKQAQFGTVSMSYEKIQKELAAVKAATKKPAAKPVEEKKDTFGAKNKIVSQEEADELAKQLRDLLGEESALHVVADPKQDAERRVKIMQVGSRLAMFYIEGGARKFGDYCQQMVAKLGDAIRPYLKSLYMAAKYDPAMAQYMGELDDEAGINAVDVMNIEKSDIKKQENAGNSLKSEENVLNNQNNSVSLQSNSENPAYRRAIEAIRDMKEKYPDAIQLFRVGDNYEAYRIDGVTNDAQDVAQILDLGVNPVDKSGTKVLAAQFPFHALDTYLTKLVRAGKRIAIVDDVFTGNTDVAEVVSPSTSQQAEEKTERPAETLGTVKKSKDTRDGSDIWLVNPKERVSREEFNALMARAKANNGRWSKFKANKGFLFRTEEDANNFNTIQEYEQTDEQTAANSQTIADQGTTIAGEAETFVDGATTPGTESAAVEDDPHHPDEDAMGEVFSVLPGETFESAANRNGIQLLDVDINQVKVEADGHIRRIDEQLEQVNHQLALLGYYAADTDDYSQLNEVYGYGLTAEKKAVKDADRLAKQLASDLGIEVSKRKTIAKANIAQAGGDITFELPLKDGMFLYVDISMDWNRNLYHNVNGSEDDLYIGGVFGGDGHSAIMYRVEDPNASGMSRYRTSNTYADADITYQDLSQQIKRTCREFLPEVVANNATTTEKQPLMTPLERAQKNAADNEAKKESRKKTNKVQDNATMGDLFADVVDEIETINNSNTDNNGESDIRRESGSSRNESGNNDGNRQSEGLQGGAGSSARSQGKEADGSNGRGQRRSNGENGSVRVGLLGSVEEKPLAESERKNTRNNRSERGVDYAPKGEKARFDANVAAVTLLKELEEKGEQATPEQMKVLRQFSGWGGLGQYFKENDYTTGRDSYKLKQLLTDEEYDAANLSRNSAYFTPAAIIDRMWDIAHALGFRGGKVLEGSAGIGDIIGHMPQNMSDRSDIQAVEIDPITGGILKQLYPDAKVTIDGFQNVNIPNGSQDLVITNVPFVTGLRVYDKVEKDLSKRFGNIHDFCIAKNVRKLREGGLGIFITTSGTMDKSKELRKWLVNEGNADIIGAFRLNNQTFGGTTATSDIIVVRKRVNGKTSSAAQRALDTIKVRDVEVPVSEAYDRKKRDFVQVTERAILDYNQYFVEHPEHMGGEMGFGFEHGDTRYGGTTQGLYPTTDIDQEKRLQAFVERMADIDMDSEYSADNLNEAAKQILAKEGASTYEEDKGTHREGEMHLNSKGEICVRRSGMSVPVAVNAQKVKGATKAQCLTDYQAIKDALAEVLKAQTEHNDDAALTPALKQLNKVYDAFTKKYGNFYKNTAISFLRTDIDFPSIQALAEYTEKETLNGKKSVEVKKSDVFSKRVVGVRPEAKPETTKDAAVLSIQKYGRLDLGMMAEWLNKSEQDVRDGLLTDRLAFEDPISKEVVVRHQYLSGNVREKLEFAQNENKDGQYDANVEELQKVIPPTIPAHMIEFSLGSTWIEPQLYMDFVKETYDVDLKIMHIGGVWADNKPSEWQLSKEKNKAAGVYSEQCRKQIYGTDLLMAAMNNVPVVVQTTRTTGYGSDKHTETITDKDASQVCSTRIDEIKDEFREWCKSKMMADTELSDRMEKTYNDRFNAIVPMHVDELFLEKHLPGQNHEFKMRPHQQQAIVKGTMQPLMIAHGVGTGKTFTLISIAMEMRRLGTAKKPMIVVQNATTAQFVGDAKRLYPNSKVLVVSEQDRTAQGRQEFYAKIKYNDWDLIIIPQSVFDMIPDSDERKRDFIREKIDEKQRAYEMAKEAGANSQILKNMEKEIGNLEQDLMDANVTGKRSSKKKNEEEDLKKKAERAASTAAKAEEMLDRRTDDIEDFDSMGIDALLIDEAHNYKHLGFATMMQRGVKGVDPSYSKKAAGLYLKCQSVFERCGHKNVVFATGTPISNTAAEVWTFMKYLLPKHVMEDNEIYYFDDFVRNFGRISQSLEFGASGKFKETTRFASYNNMPELARIWGQVSDTVLSDEAKDETGKSLKESKEPEMEGGKATDIFLEQSDSMVDIMRSVRSELEAFEKMSGKEKKEKNYIPVVMFGIASRAAIDPRLVDGNAVDEPESKTNKTVEETLRALKDSKKYNGTVAIFCDKYRRLEKDENGKKKEAFNIFKEIKRKLIEKGVPEDQIVIMESGMADTKKQRIFDDMNAGNKRVIIGTTQTLGTGVNIQERLFALIHMDAPDRPMDMTQREGRILRQGNLHKQWGIPVRVIRMGVKDSLDVTGYQRLQTKAKFIDAVMRSKYLLNNNLEGRVLEEEEEGVFDNPVAVLSGSQYAMLKSQAEREYRKWAGKLSQYNADQIYIENKTRDNKARVQYYEQVKKECTAQLALLDRVLHGEKPKIIVFDGKECKTEQELNAAIKEWNKGLQQRIANMKADTWGADHKSESVSVSFDGIQFTIDIDLRRISGYDYKEQRSKNEVRKEVRYSSDAMSIANFKSNSVDMGNTIQSIIEAVMSGRDARERIKLADSNMERIAQDNAEMDKRRGKAFEFSKELAEAKAKVDEYTKLMKEELDEKEKKYADKGNGKTVDVSEATTDDVEDTDAEAQYSTELDELRDSTEGKDITVELLKMAIEDAGINFEVVEDEEVIPTADNTEFSIRQDPAPKKTGIGYKVFYRGKDGKLYPPMVANPNGADTPVGVWLNADAAPLAGVSKTGRPQVKAGGKGTQGGSGSLAYRPGWHLGEIPYALQFNRMDENGNKTLFPKDFVWAEVEYAADVDYQKDAEAEGMNANGKFQHSLAGLKRVPENGYYRYRTNPNPATDPWIITGAMKVNRVLTNDEVDDIVRKAGREPQLRESVMQGQTQFLYGRSGKMMGYADANGIHVTKAGLNPNTMIHEYTHLWARAMEQKNREGWESIKSIFRGTPYWDEVLNDANYRNIRGDEDRVCSEVIARYSGRRGAERLSEVEDELKYEAEQSGSVLNKAKLRQMMRDVRDAITKFWKWVGTELFHIKHFESAEDVADRVLFDLLTGTDINTDNEVTSIFPEMAFDPERQKAIVEWTKKNPAPEYKIGESFDAYMIRLNEYKKRREEFIRSLDKPEPPTPSTPEPPTPSTPEPPTTPKTPLERAKEREAMKKLRHDDALVAEYVAFYNDQADAGRKIKKEYILRRLIDAAKPIEDFQDWMIRHGAKIDDESNAYTDTFLAAGRVSNESERLNRDFIRPLAKQIAKLTGKDSPLNDIELTWHNMDIDGVEEKIDGKRLTARDIIGIYCQAKDCEEAEIKGLPDRGAAGFVDKLGTPYMDIIKEVESRVDMSELNTLWDLIRKCTKFALEYDYQSGRISEDTFKEFSDREYYVPQRGWRGRDESGLETQYAPIGKRANDPYNSALIKSKGRSTLASDPFAYIMSIDNSSIISSENNKIKQKFLKFCLDNEDLGLDTGAFHVKKFWFVNVMGEDGKVMKDADGNNMVTVTYAQPDEKVFAHDKEIKKEIRKVRAELGKVQRMFEKKEHGELSPTLKAAYDRRIEQLEKKIQELEDTMRIAWTMSNSQIKERTLGEIKQHDVVVLKDGAQYFIQLKDEKLGNAINQYFKQHQEALFDTTQRMRNYTRFMSAMLTQYNPEFAASNFVRDYQVALATLAAEHKELLPAFTKHFAKAQKAVWTYAWNDKVKENEQFTDDMYGKYLKEYFRSGAPTGFSYMKDLNVLRDDFQSMIEDNNYKRGLRGAVGVFSMLTEVSETSTRFAGYVAARESGMGVNEAAYLSKELTTNFDRAGEVADSGWMSWFSFFRATLNGNIKFLKALKKMPLAYSLIAASYFAFGMLNQFLNPDDPEDEVLASDYMRESNFVIGKWRIPTAHFLRMFFAAGVNAAMWMQGSKGFGETVYNTATFATNEMLPNYLNVLGNATEWDRNNDRMEFTFAGLIQGFAPSVALPLVDVAVNRDFKGSTINREPFTKAQADTKDILLAKDHTLPIYDAIVKGVYETVGGDLSTKRKSDDPAWRSWLFDTSASSLEHVVEGYVPAGVDMLATVANAIYAGATGTPTGPDKWPFVRKFYNAYTPQGAYNQQYYMLNGRVKTFKNKLDDYKANSPKKYNLLTHSEEYKRYQKAQTLLRTQKENPTTADIKKLMEANKEWFK